jgi:lysyl-tRNA synthetase class 2
LLRRLRQFFDARGFLEVETPILSADTVVDRHLDPIWFDGGPWGALGSGPWAVGGGQFSAVGGQSPAVDGAASADASDLQPSSSALHLSPSNCQSLIANRSAGPRRWLQTSPEFAMKRLLAAGGGPIYQVARVFRAGELGPLHNPEFTMVEWYRPGDGMSEGMQLTSDVCEALLGAGAAERISYRQAFERSVGIDPLTADDAALAAAAKTLGIDAPASLGARDRDGWLDLLLVERVQPHLGRERPTLVYDFPASQAALARVRRDCPPVAERFELYVAGIELANGYHELLDAAELRTRNARVNAQRLADGKEALPEQSRLLRAMDAGLPPMVGVALGFDRLVMLAAGLKSIAEVIAFPFDRA